MFRTTRLARLTRLTRLSAIKQWRRLPNNTVPKNDKKMSESNSNKSQFLERGCTSMSILYKVTAVVHSCQCLSKECLYIASKAIHLLRRKNVRSTRHRWLETSLLNSRCCAVIFLRGNGVAICCVSPLKPPSQSILFPAGRSAKMP